MNARLKIYLTATIMAFFISASAAAQSYNAGYVKYQRGDFKGAERSLQMAVTKETAKEVKANTLKLLGICQYMLGNKNGASGSFKDALGLDTSLVINNDEVLDTDVVEFFSRIKKEVAKQESVPAAAPSSGAAEAGGKATAKKAGTYIVVTSDVPDANVMVDGILAGNAGAQIEVEPGMLMIEVNAPGHDAKFQKITAVQGEVNSVTVELIKPKAPKRIAKKKLKKSKKTAKKKRSDEDMFSEEPARPQRAGYDAATDFERDTFNGYQAIPPPQGGYPGYGGYNQQPYEQPYAIPPVAMNDRGYDDRFETRAAANNYFIAVLPFGAGQFQNRNVSGGLLFFAAEAGSLAFYLMQDKDAKSTEDELILFKQKKAAEEEELSEEDQIYINETEAYVANTRQKAKYGLYGFGLLWVAGAVEAIINDPVAKAAKQRRRYAPRPGYGLEPKSRPVLPPEERHYKAKWQVRLLPETPLPGGHDDKSLKIQWDLRF